MTIAFTPAVDLLSEQPLSLQPPDLSFDALLGHFPGLAAAEAVCFTGSTAAGWGNPFSDIDILAFSDDALTLPVDETMETWPGSAPSGLRWHNWMGRYGDSRIDIKVWSTGALTEALAPCLGQEPEFFSHAGIGHGVQGAIPDFIYRFSIGVPLKNEDFFANGRRMIDSSSYGRSMARALKVAAENALTDVAGQLLASDWTTARLSAEAAAANVADMCLVLVGDYCRNRKWLFRRLDQRPECGMSAKEYRSQVMNGPLAGESDGNCAYRTARWAQSHLVRVEPAVLGTE